MERLTVENINTVEMGDIILFSEDDMFEIFNDAPRFVQRFEQISTDFGFLCSIHFLSCDNFHNKHWLVTKEDLTNYTNYVIRL